MSRRSSLAIAALLGAGTLLCPLLPIAGLAFKALPIPTTDLRLRAGVVEIGTGADRVVLPLAGMRIDRDVRWDGTPTLTFAPRAAPPHTIAVGGHDPAEICWLVDRITAQAHAAPEHAPDAEPPDALVALVASGRKVPQ